jgi:hypothetical protein
MRSINNRFLSFFLSSVVVLVVVLVVVVVVVVVVVIDTVFLCVIMMRFRLEEEDAVLFVCICNSIDYFFKPLVRKKTRL